MENRNERTDQWIDRVVEEQLTVHYGRAREAHSEQRAWKEGFLAGMQYQRKLEETDDWR